MDSKYIEKIVERHYIVMPFNNKWYKLKMEFDMVTTNTRKKEIGGQNCCAYASRRNHVEYAHSHEDILNKYGSRIKMHEPVPEVLSGAMGNYMYLCFGEDDEAVKEFIAYVIERK